MTARHLGRTNNSSATLHKAGRSKRGLVATLSTELAKMEALFYNLPVALPRPTGNKKGIAHCAIPFECVLEATPGFEPGVKALQASALPLGHVAD